ncbi:MAG: lysophospholipid acyltransferase family protein [Terriglobales bacterium]
METSAPVAPQTAADSPREGRFTPWQRFLIWLIGWAGYLVIRVLGPTLRYNISIEDGGPQHWYVAPVIYPFWHRCLIPACFLWRQKQIAVLTSTSFDGEYIARILERFGYTPVRGSSTRGGVRGLLGMQKELESGHAIAFTIDGPKGPKYVAKPGPVLLARTTGLPIICFHIALEDPWVLGKSWDQFMIPKPFSRALLRISKLIHVPPDAQDLDRYQNKMQAALDRAREYAEANIGRAGQAGRPPDSI